MLDEKTKKILVSIIIPVKNEGLHLKNTIESIKKVKNEVPYEVIIVNDNSDDGCCDFLKNSSDKKVELLETSGVGAAMARNIGAEKACGSIFIFCDAHLFFFENWIEKLITPILAGTADAVNPGIADVFQPDRVGFGYSWDENLDPKWNSDITTLTPSPLLAGGCLAVTRNAFEAVNGFERGFQVWGREDEEFSLKLWLFGFKCYLTPDTTVLHVFREGEPPFTLNWDHIYYNLLRMAYSHFSKARIKKCLSLITNANAETIKEKVLASDVMEQREKYNKLRKYSDDWFMEKFKIPF
ncbi:glycosyl transferase family 2 [Lottiidibacillus patelloidae]|uniref:Glycosyl transferase family 2 n=1 Tax=Lottiidibacillus patelloidae TaxID=2670334 RepID=A0A263BUW8_9BACI|nr:glycosyltransferase [Lottiidibacillus patelloidae]OZM56966.1 glycosyl transferase family 2 [Lottiidibacillus patelloidae]